MYIGGNTNDPEHGSVAPLEALSDGVLARKILTAQSLADDGDRRGVAAILRREVSALDEGNAHCMKITGTDQRVFGPVKVVRCGMFQAEANLPRIAERQMT